MSMEGVPVGGLKTVDQIDATNPLLFHPTHSAMEVALALLSTHTAGAPVVDPHGKYLGFINEFEVMNALDAGHDLNKLSAEQIMRKDRVAITPSTNLSHAAKMMEQHHVVSLPVERDGVVAYSITRHDLLRARIGLGVGMGLEP